MPNIQAHDDLTASDLRAHDLTVARLAKTRHAQVRSQQRGVSDLEIDLLFTFGVCEKSHDGCARYFLDKSAKRRVARYVGVPAVAEALADRYIVVSAQDKVITVGHRLQRFRRAS